MEMQYESETNRVGIYTQTSIEATAIGAGFAPQGEKSPVVIDQPRETNEQFYGEDMSTASANSDMSQFRQGRDGSLENSENPFKKDINFSDFESASGSGKNKSKKILKQEKSKKKSAAPQLNIPSSVKQFPQSEEFFGKRRWQLALAVLRNLGYASWEINAMFSNLDSKVREGTLEHVERPELPVEEQTQPEETCSSKIVNKETEPGLRLKIGDANKQDFGISPAHRKTLILQINAIMLEENVTIKDEPRIGVHNFFNIKGKLLVVCENKRTVDLITSKLPELSRLCDGGTKLELCPVGPLAMKTLAELLEEFPKEEYDLPSKQDKQDKARETSAEPDLSTAVERKIYDDLRLSIGDANNPDFRILPEHRKALVVNINMLMTRTNNRSTKRNRVVINNFLFINRKLVVVCKNKCAVNFITYSLPELNRLCDGPKLVLCPRFGIRKTIQICIPPSELSTNELLKIISRQNGVKTDPWVVTSRCNDAEKVILDAVVDPETYYRFFKDQDEMHFLLTRATLKEIT